MTGLRAQAQAVSFSGKAMSVIPSHKMIICSAGFGITSDSPTMSLFSDILYALPGDIGIASFGYATKQGNAVAVSSMQHDAQVLREVYGWVRRQINPSSITILAHSRGCIVAAMACIYPIASVIMLAPPLRSGHSRQYFTEKPGAVKRGTDWIVPRSDGTTTIIPETMFAEYESLPNLDKLIVDYASHQPLHILFAGADQVLHDQDYSVLQADAHVTCAVIQGANHDFAGDARATLCQQVASYVRLDMDLS